MFTFLQSSLFQVGVSNAVLATGLALVVFLITWKSKWPAWTHALWVLVLVKLLAPPIYWVTAELPAIAPRTRAVATPASKVVRNNLPFVEEPSAIQVNVIETNVIPTTALRGDETAMASPSSWLSGFSVPWLSVVWLVGATGVFGLTIYRCTRFKRWLRTAKSAPADLVDLVGSVAEQVGLERVPKVLLVRGVIAPSIFSLGRRANLLLPFGLIDQLTGKLGPPIDRWTKKLW